MSVQEVEFTETDTNALKKYVIDTYQTLTNVTLARADPVRLFLEALAYIIVKQRNEIDYAAKMNLLYYAEGDFLDHIGMLVGCTRLTESAATTTIKITLSAVRPTAIIIPAGTRVADINNLMFAIDETTIIPQGDTTIETAATCLELGDTGNGIAAGEINKIVDPIAYVSTMVNTTETEGGASAEDDDSYRERIRTAPESYSVAGPEGAYEYFTKQVSSLIEDVAVVGPEDKPGEVDVYFLLTGGAIPGEEMQQKVLEALRDNQVRPLTDHVFVKPPTVVPFDTSVKYYISGDDLTTADAIKAAVNQAVSDWIIWEKSKMGRDILPSRLIQKMVEAGARRVEVSAPAYTVVDRYKVAIGNEPEIVFGGIEDE